MTTPTADLPATPRTPNVARDVPLRFAIVAVLIAIALAMGPVLRGDFSFWDDEDTIALNPDLNPPTWVGLADRWTRPHLHIYVPLTHTVWHALALVSPPAPPGEVGHFAAWPFKLTSLLAHAATSVLVLLTLRRLLGRSWVTLAGAIAFAVHPLQVESVAWTSGLKDVLFGMFSTACVLTYIGGDQDRQRPRGKTIAAALALLVLAGLSKPTAMVLPAMLFVLDALMLRRAMSQSIARLVPFVVAGSAFALYAASVQPALTQSSVAPPLLRPVVSIDSIAFYLGKLIVPHSLAYDYGHTAAVAVAAMRAAPLVFVGKAIVVLGLLAVAIASRRRFPTVTLGLLWAVIPLAPVLGFTYFDFAHYSNVADHYVYLPMLGVSLVAATMLKQWQVERWIVAVTAAVLCMWIAVSFRQAVTWHDARSITLQTLRVNPNSFASYSNLAVSELRTHRLEEAERNARRGVELAPDDPQGLFVLANVLHDRGDVTAAIPFARRAIELSPYLAGYHHRLASWFGEQRMIDEALAELDRTLTLDPRFPQAAEQREQLREFARRMAATRSTTAPTK